MGYKRRGRESSGKGGGKAQRVNFRSISDRRHDPYG